MCDWENVVPDILCTAKGLTMGFPGNAIVTTKEIAAALSPGSGVHSYAANAMVCSAIIATIDYMNELDLVNNSDKVGEIITKRLLELQSEYEMIGSVQAKGMNIGVTVVKDKDVLDKAIGIVKSFCGDLREPGKGILFACPLEVVEGLSEAD